MTGTKEEVAVQCARRQRALDSVRRVLVEALHVQMAPDDIDPDVSLFGTGLALDSVDAVELLVSLETTLSVTLPDQSVARTSMRTVNTLVDLVLAFGVVPDA